MDTPATKLAMSKAYAELCKQERQKIIETLDTEEEIEDEEEEEIPNVVIEEKDDDKAYADKLWCS